LLAVFRGYATEPPTPSSMSIMCYRMFRSIMCATEGGFSFSCLTDLGDRSSFLVTLSIFRASLPTSMGTTQIHGPTAGTYRSNIAGSDADDDSHKAVLTTSVTVDLKPVA
jgi:hypothetical protein